MAQVETQNNGVIEEISTETCAVCRMLLKFLTIDVTHTGKEVPVYQCKKCNRKYAIKV